MVKNIINSAMDEYSQKVYGPNGVAFNSPNKLQYDIDANAAAARVPSQIAEQTFPGMTGQVMGTLSDLAMPALALGSSPFYDMYQAGDRARAQYGIFNDSDPNVLGVTGDSEIPMGPSFPEYAKAVAAENIPSSMMGRTLGAGQNLADRIESGNFPLSLNNVMNAGKSISNGIGDFFFPSAAAAESEIRPDNNLNSFGLNAPEFSITDMLQQDVNKDIYNGYRPEQPASANSMGPEFYGSAPNKNFLTGILESLSDLELQDYLPFGEKSISSMAARGAGNMVRGIGNLFQGNPRQRARNEANKRFGVGDIYGYGMGPASGGNRLDAFGFNTVSGFGNYEQHMRDQLAKLDAQKKAGKTFRPGSWQEKMDKDYGKSISTIDAEAAAADRAERDKFNRMLSNMSGGGGDAGYSPGQSAGMGFGGGRTDPTDKS